MTSQNGAPDRRGGTHPGRVGNDVGIDVGNDVGVSRLDHGGHWAGTGRAAELASEAARAEGASPPRHRPWPARRGPGQAVNGEWARRPSLRGGGVPGDSPLTAGHRAPPPPPALRRSGWPLRGGREALPRTPPGRSGNDRACLRAPRAAVLGTDPPDPGPAMNPTGAGQQQGRAPVRPRARRGATRQRDPRRLAGAAPAASQYRPPAPPSARPGCCTAATRE
jgi:hypothetical protein